MAQGGTAREHSRRIAVCGLMTALGTVLLAAGALPFAMYCAPVLAMLPLLPVQDVYGGRWAIGVYGAVSVLGLLLSPEREAAVVFLILGYYPVLRRRLNRLSKLPRIAAKGAVFNGAVALTCAAAVFLFRLPLFTEEAAAAPLWVMAVLGNATFFLLDLALGRIETVYRRRWRRLLTGR